MNLVRGYETRSVKRKTIIFVFLVSVCMLINFYCSRIAELLHAPLYLDCIGTIIASMFGGYIPGMVVGLGSSLLSGFLIDTRNTSYGFLSVMIAVFVSWAHGRKWFKKPSKIILAVLNCGFLGGVLGSFLTMILYGFGEEDTSVGLVKIIYNWGFFNSFWSEILGDFIVDIFDKAVSIGIALIVLYLTPDKIKGQFKIHAWKQAPLTGKASKMLVNNKTRGMSLRYKIAIFVSVASALVSMISIIISYILYKDSMAEFIARTGTQVTEYEIQIRANRFIVNQLALFLGVFMLVVAEFIYLARYTIILPLNTMAYATSHLSKHEGKTLEELEQSFCKLDIRTGDETENLYKAIHSMLRESVAYVEDIKKKNATISELQNSLIIVLADLVESRDYNTGNHIKATAEYVELIMDEMITEGIYQEQMTPQFVSDVYRSAPLHDIGKISVSDVILNKPGKLTDEEFAIMKNHSLAGAEIIDHVIETLPNSDGGYLHEARNLALYHHEKWNGTGYPYGIAGEEIPLSARIMAVADVFDALVSNRSYKKAFEFDKAISIIEESAGTHFDPLIAKAFLNAKDRIKKVAEEKDWDNS